MRQVGRPSSRQKILDAAQSLAREQGAGHISLDAVATRAGLSKGGLLYHFATKTKLLEALVEGHIRNVESALEDTRADASAQPNAAAIAYLDMFCQFEQPASAEASQGVIAAIVENPDLVEPIRAHHRKLIDTISGNAADPNMAIIAFLAVEGLRSLRLLNSPCITPPQVQDVLDRLRRQLTVG